MSENNIFDRARLIRMEGEPWQNALQRAGSQIRYETQVGSGTGCRKKNSYKKGSKGTSHCYVSKKGRCALSSSARGHKPRSGWETRAAPGYVESLQRWHSQEKGLAAYQKQNQEKIALQREAFGIASKVHTGPGSRALRNQEIALAMADPESYLEANQQGGARKSKKSSKKRGKVGPPHTVNCLYNPETARCTLSCEGRRKSNARRQAQKGTRSGSKNKNSWNLFLHEYSQRAENKGLSVKDLSSKAALEYRARQEEQNGGYLFSEDSSIASSDDQQGGMMDDHSTVVSSTIQDGGESVENSDFSETSYSDSDISLDELSQDGGSLSLTSNGSSDLDLSNNNHSEMNYVNQMGGVFSATSTRSSDLNSLDSNISLTSSDSSMMW